MRVQVIVLFGFLICSTGLVRSEVIDGTVIVKKKLTKRRVTASLPLYHEPGESPFCAGPDCDPGTIVVRPNAWFSRADRDGHFQISDVPPGDYTAITWHKATSFLRKELEVVAGKSTNLEFLVPLDEDGRSQTSKLQVGK